MNESGEALVKVRRGADHLVFLSVCRLACQEDLLQAAVRQQEVGWPVHERPPRWQRGWRGGAKAKRNEDLTAGPIIDLSLDPSWPGAQEVATQSGLCKLDASQPMYVGMDEATGKLAAAMNITIAAVTGGIVVFFLRLAIYRWYGVGGLCNGILAGLVSVTAAWRHLGGPVQRHLGGNVEAGSALAIGITSGFVYHLAYMLLRKLKINDPVDAVPVHAAVLFYMGQGKNHFHGWSGFGCVTDDASNCQDGLFGEALAAHLIMIGFIVAFSGLLSGLVFFLLKLTGCLRIDEATEDSRMDAAKHPPSKAYAMESVI